MRKTFTLIAVMSMVLAVSTAWTAQDDEETWWSGSPQMDLKVNHVDIEMASNYVSSFKNDGPQNLGGPGAGTGASNFCADAYTAPTWVTGWPSIEEYSFPTSQTYIDNRVVVVNNAGPWPTPVSLAFVWQACGNVKIFPPIPSTFGTNCPWDGHELALTLPYAGRWYITVGVSGFLTGTWDWMWFARYDGIAPIPVIPLGTEGNDHHGGSYETRELFTGPGDVVGAGESSGRPWCFEVVPDSLSGVNRDNL
jgi:hypothetical protein